METSYSMIQTAHCDPEGNCGIPDKLLYPDGHVSKKLRLVLANTSQKQHIYFRIHLRSLWF